MKPAKIITLALILALMVPNVYGADFPRHIDPGLLALDNPDAETLFNIYLDIISEITASNYEDANSILSSIEDITALQSAENALDQYNLLLRSVIHDLNQTETTLRTAYIHLDWLRDSEANGSLRTAYFLLDSANSSSQTMGDDGRSLARVLNGSPETLLEGKARLDEFINELNREVEDGFETVDIIKLARLEGLQETRLSISPDTSSPWVGSTLTVSGSLTTNDEEPLGGKILTLSFGGETINIVTGDSGGFSQPVEVPYVYVDSMPLTVSYWPTSLDFTYYTPSVETQTIEPMFFTPNLSLNLPETVYPGVQYMATASVQHLGGFLTDVALSFNAFSESYESMLVEEGVYRFYFNIPSTAHVGNQRVTLMSSPDELYGPSNLVEVIEVVRMPLSVDLDSEDFLISGQNAVISGTVKAITNPVVNCTVEVQLGDTKISTYTDESGGFTTIFPQSVYSLSLRREYTVKVTPVEPWISRVFLSNSILVVNALSLVAAPLLFLAVLVRRKPRVTPTIAPVYSETPSTPIIYPELTGVAGIYVKALRFIGELSGQYLGKSSTIQEYLEKIETIIGEPVYRLFRQLSNIYERWIYGPKVANPPVNVSENILDQLMDEDE